MSALLEYQCQVSVGGYEVITIEKPYRDDDARGGPVVGVETWRILQPRSERTKRVDLFKASPSAFLEFAQTPATEDAIKDFADRYGLLFPDIGTEPKQYGRDIDTWSFYIRSTRQIVELWERLRMKHNFSKIVRAVQTKLVEPVNEFLDEADRPVSGVPVELFLKEDPSSAAATLCIRPRTLFHALCAQLVLAIDGNMNLGTCVQCRKWFRLDAGRGRSDKQYCSDACRMRAYRKRKVSG
jgi:hypothetical protein